MVHGKIAAPNRMNCRLVSDIVRAFSKERFHSTPLSGDDITRQKMDYVHHNPVRKFIAAAQRRIATFRHCPEPFICRHPRARPAAVPD